MSGVLIFMTVHAQQLPVAAVCRIVVVIVVSVMYGKRLEIRVSELARASATNPGINPERLFAIGRIPLFPVAPCFSNNAIQLVTVRLNEFRSFGWH